MAARFLLSLLLVVVSFSSFARSNDLMINLSLVDRTTVSDQDVMVNVTFTNVGQTPLQLVRWYVPDGDLDGDLFVLSRDGQDVPYVGPLVKRGSLTNQDLMTLQPGESVQRTVELAAVYDLSTSGVYSIRYTVAAAQVFAPGSMRVNANVYREAFEQESIATTEMLSNEVSTFVAGRPNAIVEQGKAMQASMRGINKVGAITYTGRCSATQQSTLVSAHSAASTMTNDSTSYLNGTPSATSRYTTWFGSFSTAGWNEVKGHFVAIKDALDTKPITYDCSCKKSYYAYVYPTQPYKVYLCRAFWDAPMSGTDSKGGTIVHELSHFNVIAATNDYAYGHTAAKQLAISNPTQARMNADSHEYFAENTPLLP